MAIICCYRGQNPRGSLQHAAYLHQLGKYTRTVSQVSGFMGVVIKTSDKIILNLISANQILNPFY